ncbi:subtilisin-like protease Glyma18g48580 [Vigna radiata var. radiata]|uniref:Subtilisin-like protease Glyma18g48580 n=1 Tax=Vigna radiata var. radiata TaxID=3916 RepID=A0A1S3UE42_VIGRR|nr:subtilisin-like protease Glyma18g48580 [Vigna radiata var. radiata]
MASSIFKLFLSSIILCTMLQPYTEALRKTYIVYLGEHSHGPNPSLRDIESATNSHHDLLAPFLGSHEKAKEAVMYSYNKHINGFAAQLEEEEASEIAKHPSVISVFLSKEYKLHTTRSWDFLGLEKYGGIPAESAWWKGKFGEDTIIGNLDSGVWPEHPSFNDNGYGPLPSTWRGNGVCQIDRVSLPNKTFCNRKLIGARIFSKGYEAHNGKLDPSKHTARDFVGHGTHTMSIAAGNFAPGATVFGNGNGTAKGGSPKARIAAYKVCWSTNDAGSCHEADILQAFDHAINDGVHVITASIGGSNPYIEAFFTDGISIGAFHAVARNIVVVCSAGNDGPAPRTVVNVAPWTFTVAASTIDRDFLTNISLGKNHHLKGASLNRGLPSRKYYPLVHAANARLLNATIDDARLCKPGTLDTTKIKGNILICIRRDKTSSVAQSYEADNAGAVGVFVVNDDKSGNTLLAEPYSIPGANVDPYEDADIDEREWWGKGGSDNNNSRKLAAYMTVARTYLGIKPAPIMAGFSSRGPSAVQPLILKPDVTAPGVNILAAYSLAASPSNLPSDRRRIPFNMQQGTSMSGPHVAGIAGLLRTLHPDWSPAAIKSAIMTTATTLDNNNLPIRDAFDQIASPFDYGSGHIQPNHAMDPGLVYDMRKRDYLNFICAHDHSQNFLRYFSSISYNCPESYNIENLNYPSITVANRGLNPINVTRTVTNVGTPTSTYVVKANITEGFKVLVQPSSLSFKTIGEKKTFRVILQATSWPSNGFPVFGNLSWTDGNHTVTSPIVVL